MDGLTTLDEFTERTGLVLPEGPYDTLAGYFMAQLGRLPSVGDQAEVEVGAGENPAEGMARLELQVRALDGRRASAFVVRRLNSQQPSLEDQ